MKHRIALSAFACVAVFLSSVFCRAASEAARYGFETGLDGWQVDYGNAKVKHVKPGANGSSGCFCITDTGPEESLAFKSPKIPVDGASFFRLTVWSRITDGIGGSVRAIVYDKNGKRLDGNGGWISFSSKRKDLAWDKFEAGVLIDNEAAAYMHIKVESWTGTKITVYIDDVLVERLSEEEAGALPWEPQYRLGAEDKSKLTEADVVGPDGLVYPNWSMTGVQIDREAERKVFFLDDFGGKPNDHLDDSAAMKKACRKIGQEGGGVLLLDAGTYYMDQPLLVTDNNIVIRGAGRDQTKIDFRYRINRNVEFYELDAGQTIGRLTVIGINADPTHLTGIDLYVDDTLARKWDRPGRHAGNRSFLHTNIKRIADTLKPGKHTLRAEARYLEGGCHWTKRTEIEVNYSPDCKDENRKSMLRGAIAFVGEGSRKGEGILLAEDGRRGSKTLVLKEEAHLKPGDTIRIDGPATDRWKRITKNACRWGTYRSYMVKVEKCEGNKVTLVQPLRIDFPVIDGSLISKLKPIEGCAIEDLSIEQMYNYFINTVHFQYAVNCWAKGVKVTMCGRNPVYFYKGKWCEISDCVFDDVWFNGSGGTGYTGWEHCYDCLMEDVETFKMRHAPLFQWSASGCVIRNGVFHNSDAQWHSGWTNENLMENCVVTSVSGNGGYGHGMWASPPSDGAHGPNGPRNVVYNCDVSAERDGVWLGGMNENWLILHSRFRVKGGSGFFTKTASFHHVLQGNVFALENSKKPMSVFVTPDCRGAWIMDNTLYGGNGKFVEGFGKPGKVSGNRALPYEANPPRPAPACPSIYEWQQENAKKTR